jgi:hypothetical protein
MSREFFRVLIVLGLQLLATFAETAFDKAAENERRERSDD